MLTDEAQRNAAKARIAEKLCQKILLNNTSWRLTTALQTASRLGAIDELYRGQAAIHYAAHFSGLEMYQQLIGWGANPNTKNEKGQKASDVAKERGNILLANFLEKCETDEKFLDVIKQKNDPVKRARSVER